MIDVVQRYTPIVNFIKKQKLKNKKVVEVGGTGEGIAFYLPSYKIIDCDIEFVKNILPNVQPIKYNGKKLPLPNNHTDIALSVDMLEHLPNKKRQKEMIKEILRIAKKTVILAVPCGEKSLKATKKFSSWFQRKYPQTKHKYLEEHLKYGHPKKNEILKMIKNSGYKTKVHVEKNSNIQLWLLFQKMYLKFPKLYLVFRYRKLWYNLLKPIFPICNFGETMRNVFYINLQKNNKTQS